MCKYFKKRFRSKQDITIYLVRYFQNLEGWFSPRKSNFGKHYVISDCNDKMIKDIKKKKHKMICINDDENIADFEKTKKEINQAFNEILPEKSLFEK